jgi:hypothetical protein
MQFLARKRAKNCINQIFWRLRQIHNCMGLSKKKILDSPNKKIPLFTQVIQLRHG